MNTNAQQELEDQRMLGLLLILQKADMARKDGYFTDNDLADMKREFGFSNMETKHENV